MFLVSGGHHAHLLALVTGLGALAIVLVGAARARFCVDFHRQHGSLFTHHTRHDCIGNSHFQTSEANELPVSDEVVMQLKHDRRS